MQPKNNIAILITVLVIVAFVGARQLHQTVVAEVDRASKIEEANSIVDQVRTKSYTVWLRDESGGGEDSYSVSLETAMEGANLDDRSLSIQRKGLPGAAGMVDIMTTPLNAPETERPGWSVMDVGNGKHRVKYTTSERGTIYVFLLDSFSGEVEPDNDNAIRIIDLLNTFSRP